MIHYVACRDHLYTLAALLEVQPSLEGRVVPVAWEYLLDARDRPAGAWIFSDLDRLSTRQRRAACRVWDELNAAGHIVLNHPEHALRRYELLRTLHRAGINHFDAHRAWRLAAGTRFPVFVRREDEHLGPATGLLKSRAPVAHAILDYWLRGRPPRHHSSPQRRAVHRLIAVEHLDTGDADGVYRKYACFVVGKAVVPRHLFFGSEWLLKSPMRFDKAHLDEERSFLETNPHEAALREVLDLVGIDYGRIDYALHEGEVQIWEINTNPMVMHRDDRRGPRAGVHALFHEPFLAALDALDA